jgi:hypothetical protein
VTGLITVKIGDVLIYEGDFRTLRVTTPSSETMYEAELDNPIAIDVDSKHDRRPRPSML